MVSQVVLVVKNPCANAGDVRDAVGSLGGKIPWKSIWQPTPVFSPEKSHWQRGLVGYSPWGRRESDLTEHTHTMIFAEFVSLCNRLHKTVLRHPCHPQSSSCFCSQSFMQSGLWSVTSNTSFHLFCALLYCTDYNPVSRYTFLVYSIINLRLAVKFKCIF